MLFKSLREKKYPFPISDHYNGKQFFNPHAKEKFPYFRLLKWLIQHREVKWPNFVANKHTCNLPKNIRKGEIASTFINHASFLIQTVSLNIIIDPIYSKRISPCAFFGPKRVRLPGVPFSDLPLIDLVLISHNHYDHLDLNTLKRIKKAHNPLFITGLGNKRFLNSYGFKKVIELDWWEKHFYQDTEIEFVPAQHFSARTLFDRNRTLWGGFVIRTQEKTLYHAGDSGYGPHFKEIHQKIGRPDLSLLPIGCYKPRWFMKKMHINPEEALTVHMELGSQLTIPMHYGTFPLSDEPFDQPLSNLSEAIERRGISGIKVLKFGQTIIIK